MSKQGKCCGLCKWWKVIMFRVGDCKARLPKSVDECHRSRMLGYEGARCPCFKPRTSNRASGPREK